MNNITKMYFLRFAGDLATFIALNVLLIRIVKTGSCAGLSSKSLDINFLVYFVRYIMTFFYNLPYFVLSVKIILIMFLLIVFLVNVPFRKTYDHKNDSFHTMYTFVPAVIMTLLTYFVWYIMDYVTFFWTVTLYLEATAAVPQIFMIRERGEAESITPSYLFFLLLNRVLYSSSWLCEFVVYEAFNLITVVPDVLQTIICGLLIHSYRRAYSPKSTNDLEKNGMLVVHI